MKIVLVVAHTRSRPGAVNERTGLAEHDLSSTFVAMVDQQLAVRAPGIETVIIRRPEPNNHNEEVALINAHADADVCASFHFNAFDKRTDGCEVLYWTTSTRGFRLARGLQDELARVLMNNPRGAKEIKDGDRGAYILRDTTMPCVLLEPAFIDSDADLANFISKMPTVATVVADQLAIACL